jgi:ABC-2 type transport system permease protein
VQNLWWPVLIVLLETAAITVVAYSLSRIRDLGQGFIPARPGHRDAKQTLLSPFGLSWRLLRNPLIAWTAGMFVMSASYGSIMGDIETFIEGNEFYRNLMIQAPDLPLAESFAATITIMISICCVIPVILAVFKLRSEEKDGRLEHILARAVSRTKYLAGFAALSFIASIAVPFAAVTGLYAVSVSVMDNPISFGFYFEAMMVYLPALWVMTGLSVLLTGLIPKATIICWLLMGYSIFALFFGRIIDGFPAWAEKITPFGYIPQLPVDEVNYLTLAILTLIAAALTAAGFAFYRKRDMLTV